MEYRTLGGSGIQVSRYCLGAMMFGGGANPDHDECVEIVHAALDAGINFVDTSDAYSRGESEEILAKALRGRRDKVVIATKSFFPMGRDPNRRGGSRRWILEACDDSLRRLQTDYIDLYQLHRIDPNTDLEESLSALTDLVRQGKVRAIGTSTARAEQIVECQWVAEKRGLTRMRSEQPPYSIFTRSVETAVLPTCLRYGLGTLVWGPLNGGWLAGKYRRDAPPPAGSRAEKQFYMPMWWDRERAEVARKFDLVEALEKLAADAGCSLTHLALAFTTTHPGVTSAIIGPRTPDQAQDLLSGLDLRLPSDVLDRIDELVPPGTDVDATNTVPLNPDLTDVVKRRRGSF